MAHNYKTWTQLGLLWTGVWFFVNISPTNADTTDVAVTDADRTITLGPCTWIIDRKCPDEDVKFYLFTRSNKDDRRFIYIDRTLGQSNLSDSNFNPSHPTKIIIHGYNSDMYLTTLISMKDEYFLRGDYNIFYVDWSVLAPGPCYISAVHNTRHAGACVAQLVERILETGTSNIHLIGFSLGAQLCNFVARNLGSFVIPRITGLDPAMPLFITSGINDKLDPTDASFVDVIHTNALVQGKLERCGHVDFYMNGGIMQPGCYQQDSNPFACSHQRAPAYFMESIRSFTGFWGWACSSYINYLLGICPPTNFLVAAGEHTDPTIRGMYLVVTNEIAPFARGKWTDIDFESKSTMPLFAPVTKQDPLLKEVDQWGKLEGTFNNIVHFPTPYSQDPNGGNWPYFGPSGTKEITEELQEKDEEEEEYYNELEVRRRTRPGLNSKHRRKHFQTTSHPMGVDTNLIRPQTASMNRRRTPAPSRGYTDDMFTLPVYREN